MARRAQRGEEAGWTRTHGSLGYWAERHADSMRARNFSAYTVKNHRTSLSVFLRWCEARSVFLPEHVTQPMLERYQRYLYFLRNEKGRALSFGTQKQRLIALKTLFKWLMKQHVLLSNPASELELPRPELRLPAVLTEEEMERVLAQPDLGELVGVRDRAILETLYSTGMRRMEVLGLSLYDIDQERGTVLIRQGKGKRDRMVPIGARALAWVTKYLAEARPHLSMSEDEKHLFVSSLGGAMQGAPFSQRVHAYVKACGKRGACHLFRHTMATLMLEGGADVRYVQQMLGHASLESTQLYTHVSIRQLQAVHAATHPAASASRRARAESRDAEATSEARDVSEAQRLLAALAREGEDGEPA